MTHVTGLLLMVGILLAMPLLIGLLAWGGARKRYKDSGGEGAMPMWMLFGGMDGSGQGTDGSSHHGGHDGGHSGGGFDGGGHGGH